ncbi:response regulator transcription factor [Streptomyces sp. NPDC093984]|uniref:response regulator transcription factor n=1 Tax=Streptomyces sp. NPDC093984 TaxID=3366052 RepID=UPI0038264A3E
MRVLVIEDVRGLAAAIAHGLAEEGFVTRVVHDGIDGLWRAVHEPYDAILLDLMLPGISGYEVLKRLRAARVWTPVLVLTAKDGEYDEADALDLGADDYLSKPFSYVVLVARLRALLRRGAPARPAVLAAGDLALDPARRHCRRADREITLTAREFTLLEFLLRHPDEVISKTDILDHVWDENFDGDTNIVEVYIGYLRRKIDAPFGRRTIETVRGAGYRLHATGR